MSRLKFQLPLMFVQALPELNSSLEDELVVLNLKSISRITNESSYGVGHKGAREHGKE